MSDPVVSNVAGSSFLGASSAAPNEWEVLTMSMSSSAFGPPSTPSVVPTCPRPKSVADVEVPLVHLSGCDRAIQKLPLEEERLSVHNGNCAQAFTEGWKPEIPDVIVDGKFKEDRFQEICGDEPCKDSDAFMRDCNMIEEDKARAVRRDILPDSLWNQAEEHANMKTLKEHGNMKHRKGHARIKVVPFWKSKVVWSVATATAVLGFVIVLHQLHRERVENQQLRLKISAKDQELERLVSGMSRFQKMLQRRL